MRRLRRSPAFQAAPATPQMLCQTQVIGNRRIPKESILARLFSRPGDPYDPAVVERDFNSLWNTGYFDDVRIERVDEPGLRAADRLCARKAHHPRNQLQGPERRLRLRRPGALQEGEGRPHGRKPVRPDQVKRAEVVLQEMLGEHGHQFATISTEIKTIPPAAVALTFIIKEGPTVKVGKIKFTGNHRI